MLKARTPPPTKVSTVPTYIPDDIMSIFKTVFSSESVNPTSFESERINHIGGDDAHRDADVEGDGAEQVDVRVDVLVEVVGADGGDGGVADPEGVVGEVEEGD